MANINGRYIGRYQRPYMVAEISGNHYGRIEKALELIEAASSCGADAVKFQCYEPDTITLNCDKNDFTIKAGPWKGRRLHELYSKACTPFSWFPMLFERAKMRGITAFASVFDESSVELLEKLDCPAYKIASMEIVDIPLIDLVAKTGKPVIISTGMAIMSEIDEAMSAVGMAGIPLACVSGYPTPPSEFGLGLLRHLLSRYGDAGISDHSLGSTIPIAATAMGACLIEKHLCLSRGHPIEDAAFSMEPGEFRQMVDDVETTWLALQPKPINTENRELRRSLYVVEDMKAGDVFTKQNLRSIRPFHGLPPRDLPNILGCKARLDIERGTPLQRFMVEV